MRCGEGVNGKIRVQSSLYVISEVLKSDIQRYR